MTATEVRRLRGDFPILAVRHEGHPLVYLDNAATSQKPQCVIEATARFYSEFNANVHRGVHFLSEAATAEYEAAREKVRRFLGARDVCEIVFTRGATESINLVAQTFGRERVGPDDEVLVSELEHHSNLLPWQRLCAETGAALRRVPISDTGDLDMEAYARLLTPRAKLVALTHVSNAIGTITPVEEAIRLAHDHGVPVLIDAAQSVQHIQLDVKELGCDFLVFSGHKTYGPTGIGVLYGRAELLEAMPPWQSGGDMALSVSFERTVYAPLPAKFEAGTPNIAGAVGLGAALDYIETVGRERIAGYESELARYALEVLDSVPGLRLVGNAPRRVPVISFTMECAHPHDIEQVLSDRGVAIRAGHHCAQPLLARMGVPATARASLAFYNTRDDIDMLRAALETVREVFG